MLDRDAVRERHVFHGELALDLGGDGGEVDGDVPLALVVQGAQHGVVDGPVRGVPGQPEGLGTGEGVDRVVHEGAHGAPQRPDVHPVVDLVHDSGADGVRDRVPHGRVRGQRRHGRDVAPRVGEVVRRPGRERAARREQAGEGDQRRRQGAPQARRTRGHPSSQRPGGGVRERYDSKWVHRTYAPVNRRAHRSRTPVRGGRVGRSGADGCAGFARSPGAGQVAARSPARPAPDG